MPKHRKLRIPHKAIMRAPYLLSLRYPLTDLCSELGVDATTIHVWMRNGLPYERDARKHIHVHGRAVSNWIESVRCKSSPKKPMPAGQAFCLRCRQSREMSAPTQIYQSGKLRLLQSNCPVCGTKINRSVVE